MAHVASVQGNFFVRQLRPCHTGCTRPLWHRAFRRRIPRSDVASHRVSSASSAPRRRFCGRCTEEHGARDAEAVHDQPAQPSLLPECTVARSFVPPLSLTLSLSSCLPLALLGKVFPLFFSSPVTFPYRPIPSVWDFFFTVAVPSLLPRRLARTRRRQLLLLRALGVVGQCLWGEKRRFFVTTAV